MNEVKAKRAYRCCGSATENFSSAQGGELWTDKGTAFCNVCGKRVGLYPYGSTLAREAGLPVGWRLKTHYKIRYTS